MPESQSCGALCGRATPVYDPVRPVDGRAIGIALEEAVDLPAGVDPPGAHGEPAPVGFRNPLRGQLADMQAELVDLAPHEPVEEIAIESLCEIAERHGGVQRPR